MRRAPLLAAALAASLAAAGVVLSAPGAARDDIPGLSSTDQTAGMPKSALDLAAIPLGTGKSSASPEAGRLYRCGGPPSGGPPVKLPPWVHTSAGTWDATAKVAAGGDVTWKRSFTAVHRGKSEVLTGNGLPARSGTFPVGTSDPAYAYNPNPGSVTAHTIKLTLPYNPTVAKRATCEAAIVGIGRDGIPILDGFDAGGNDAAAVEVQDECHGHPNDVVGYHYHGLSPCLLTPASLTHATRVGWALDGFGIYVEYDAQGRLLTNGALDGCHGRTSVVPWHGKQVRIYHYDMTFEFPYSVGCFRGTPVSFKGLVTSAAGGSAGSGPPPPGGGGSPPGGSGG
jgi:YHYH protein